MKFFLSACDPSNLSGPLYFVLTFLPHSTECVNDPISGSVPTAFGRLTDYIWEKEEPCVPVCDESDEVCDRGERIIKFMQVYPKIQELRTKTVNCTYSGPWTGKGPVSDNVTGTYHSLFISTHNITFNLVIHVQLLSVQSHYSC